jgi:hypothetical protein
MTRHSYDISRRTASPRALNGLPAGVTRDARTLAGRSHR